VSIWADVFLGVIALATLASAIVQVGVLIAAGRVAKRVESLARSVEQELKPLFGHLNSIGRDASRTASLASAQVERADRLFADLVQRVEQYLNVVQATVAAPVREGAAVLAGLRAVISALRNSRGGRSRSRADDEDALFI
jgi:hypothetical protein